MKMRKKAMIVMSLLTLLLVLSACGSREEIYGRIAKSAAIALLSIMGLTALSMGTKGAILLSILTAASLLILLARRLIPSDCRRILLSN